MARDKIAREAVAQPLAPPLAARTRGDWSARTRGTALDALRYSQFVVLMKRALPIAAAVLLAAVIAYSFIPRQPDRVAFTYESMGRIDNDLAMIKPRLTGSDAKGNPFVITAEAAIQDPKNVRRARLKKVEADLSLDSQRWINATATEGFFDMDAGTLKLYGGLSLFSDMGYELHTANADVDLRKGIVSGPGAVTGHGPLGSVRADSFTLDRFKRLVTLTGNVRTIIFARGSKQ